MGAPKGQRTKRGGVPLEDHMRCSHLPRRRFKGKTVMANGSPRSNHEQKMAGRIFWERDGKRDQPPVTWIRGWR